MSNEEADWFKNTTINIEEAPFESIQGEGSRSGTSSLFVKLGGTIQISAEDLYRKIAESYLSWVVFTGAVTSLRRIFINRLQTEGLYCSAEVDGLQSIDHLILDWIVVVPNGQKGKITLEEWKQREGDEIRVPWPNFMDSDIFINHSDRFSHRFVSPIFEAKGLDSPVTILNIEEATKFCMAHPSWKLSLPIQKIIGVK